MKLPKLPAVLAGVRYVGLARPSAPINCGLTKYTKGLPEWYTPTLLWSVSALTSALTPASCWFTVNWPPLSLNGRPVWNRKTDPRVQPPATASATLLRIANCRPFPKGRSYVPNACTTCRRSHGEGARSSARFRKVEKLLMPSTFLLYRSVSECDHV